MEHSTSVVAALVGSRPWLGATAVLIAGWALALLLRLGLSRLLELVRFNLLCEKIGVSEFLRKGQVRHRPSKLVGILAFWTVLVIAFFEISRILDIKVLRSVSDRLAESASGVVAAVFIGIIGVVVLSFIGNFVATVARTAAFPHTRLLARAVKAGGGLIILVLALEQINISGTILSSLFQILFAAVAFGLALAFGLGGKDLARDTLRRLLDNLREKGRAHKSSDLEG